jgi:hypothetical protein
MSYNGNDNFDYIKYSLVLLRILQKYIVQIMKKITVLLGKFLVVFGASANSLDKNKSSNFLNLKKATTEEIEQSRCKQYDFIA